MSQENVEVMLSPGGRGLFVEVCLYAWVLTHTEVTEGL